jgi:adhesin transport system membrane fusion protein
MIQTTLPGPTEGRRTLAQSRSREAQLSSLSRAVALEETGDATLVRALAFVLSLVLFIFIGWTAYATVSEIARAPGEIVPLSRTRAIQSLEGGIITDIAVKERMRVKAGDVLLRLEGTGAEEDFAELRANQEALLLKAERIGAYLEKRTPRFEHFGAEATSVERERIAYESMGKSAGDEAEVIREQLSQKRKMLSVIDAQTAMYQRNLALAQKETRSFETLRAKGLSTDTRLNEARRRLSEAQGQLASTLGTRGQAEASIQEYENRLRSLTSGRTDGLLKELIETKNSLALNAERIRKLEERVDRMTIRAPIDGIVKGIHSKPRGTVVRPGEVLCEIVPTGEELIASVRILPKDIGNVQIGQDVRVKISSYDFARYGALDGRLSLLSADSYADASGNAYFEGQVSLRKDHMVSGDKKLPLLPGMTVEADIVTGEKTVLGYLLKPMRNAFDGALGEK